MTAPIPTLPAGDPPAPTPTTPTTTPPTPAPSAGDPPTGDKPLGPGGEKALQAEREARKALEKQIAALAPLQKLAEALGAGAPQANGKSEVELLNEKFATYEADLQSERQARWRAEVAAEKGLTAAQARRLQGSTREELEADAADLLASFPAAPAGPRTPAPDPSQGARGASAAADLDAQIAEAQKNRDYRTVIRLQRQKLPAGTK